MDSSQIQSDIQFIKNIINDANKSLEEKNSTAVIWGTLVFIGLIYNYLSSTYLEGKYIFLIWILITFLGWGLSILDSKKRNKKRVAKSFAIKLCNAVWFSCGIAMTIIGFSCALQVKSAVSPTVPFSYIITYMAINPLISIILGIGYYLTGTITKNNKKIIFAFCWWAESLVLFYWKSLYGNLVFAVMILILQIIPGIIHIKKQNKK